MLFLAWQLVFLFAQKKEKEEKKKKGFSKQNLFTGGSIPCLFTDRYVPVGGRPDLRLQLANWVDAGIAFNYTILPPGSVIITRSMTNPSDKFMVLVRSEMYPVPILFFQAQAEHNFIQMELSKWRTEIISKVM